MKALVINNYDSFVFNLVQYLGELGANLEVKLNDEITLSEVKEASPDFIVISPGPCTPKEAGVSIPIIREYGKSIPILGVCLGHQSIAEAYGGKVVRAKHLMHGKTSRIEHDEKTVFKDIRNPFIATRYHSLIVDEETLPSELEVSARSLDDNYIMGVRHKKYSVEGLQCHPESVLTSEGKKILENFIDCYAR